MQTTSRLLSLSSNSPSFGSFSSAVDLASIAARVVEELRDQDQTSESHNDDEKRDDDYNYEFAFDCPSRRCSHPIATADEIFCNGQIRPSYPYGGGSDNSPAEDGKNGGESTVPRRRRPALRKLMSEERDPTSNSPSEEEEEEGDGGGGGDDLSGVPPESYCVWTPKHSSKIKSNSAGFSKRWKLRNILLYARSSSEGSSGKLVFPEEKGDETTNSDQGGEESDEAKRQTLAPYRKDMIGILKNVNGLSRHLRPF